MHLVDAGRTAEHPRYLEAPEYIYLDDDWDRARIFGTGLEDYFMGGWYFREGTFAGPYHGLPIKDTLESSVAMYPRMRPTRFTSRNGSAWNS